jgi:hypothetical protein
MSSVRRVQETVRTMTVSERNPQQKFREDTALSMEVLSLYADPIWPELTGSVLVPVQSCWVSTHPTSFLGHYTHRVSWNFPDCQVANSERCLT